MNIKDLAQHLGLSIGTVSRALNGKPDVNAQTRARVLGAASQLGYRPNASGRSLRRGSTQTVAFVMETGRADVRGDNFFVRIIDAMQDRLAAEDHDLIVLPSNSANDPTGFLRRTIARGIADAIVVTATQAHDPRIALLLDSRMPFLSFGRSQIAGSYAWIDLDFEGFLREAMAGLAALGHRRIAVSTPQGPSNIGMLMQATCREVCARLGLDSDPTLIVATESHEYGGNLVTRQLLDRPDPPTAVILHYEMMAFGAYSALRDAGLSPGPDMSIVTMRRSRQLRFLDPPVSACEIDVVGLGRRLADETLRVIRADDPPAQLLWPARPILTDSVAPPRGR
ncbi:LacI family DNA-binding transcriptional regulator [Paracoccus liaowanqingii]|uniref:LacI family DNA-binding transcriptional regulator n=1 Tax=Paracoccus liaowanqingii TaxID=2560053 RepID=A0A4Z1CDF0_9RHOB|nr:LacI family DNA-binding transcriptional regulator [Paracoccus liaowanqingii]TGN62363.1 LacI family DNA-binding transcriptional regulator [Paracoccus liaowanqingii]